MGCARLDSRKEDNCSIIAVLIGARQALQSPLNTTYASRLTIFFVAPQPGNCQMLSNAVKYCKYLKIQHHFPCIDHFFVLDRIIACWHAFYFGQKSFLWIRGYAGAWQHVDRGINFPGRGSLLLEADALYFILGFFYFCFCHLITESLSPFFS